MDAKEMSHIPVKRLGQIVGYIEPGPFGIWRARPLNHPAELPLPQFTARNRAIWYVLNATRKRPPAA